jgi:hypothetical protein
MQQCGQMFTNAYSETKIGGAQIKGETHEQQSVSLA